MEKEKGHPKAAPKTHAHYADLSASAQRKRLLDALRCGPVTTIEARRNLDILMPAARVHELKHRHGYNIQTLRTRQQTDCGKLHCIAQYVLLPGSADHGK
ncbi:MAG: helix-turn-helix domain-containing protein [Candidatus Dechloromonas phosphoritropha]